ncbi:Cytosol non-specific dipeptidase [subsurface metagenome]
MEILITGLQGGHSGIEINKPLGSAIKLGARILSKLSQEVDIFLGHWYGGEKMNAIPRESKIVIGIPINKIDLARSIFEHEKGCILDYYNGTENQLEPNMQIIWTPTDVKSVLSLNESQQIISSVNLIPHGVQNYSSFNTKLVETSINCNE